MSANPFENPFKKISNEWKKGIQKMQENFKSVLHIPSDSTHPESDGQINDANVPNSPNSEVLLENSEPQEPFNETEGEQQSVIETETSGNANMNGFQKNWNTLVQNSQQTFKKWQDDWDTYVKQNQEKMQTRNAKMRAQWEENNQKVKTYFQKQQEEFSTKTKKMQEEFRHQQVQNQIDQQKTVPTLTQTWNKMMAQQKKDMDNFQKIQSRMRWKGYFNFVLWILAFIAVIAAILYILQLAGINVGSFIHT